MPPGPQVKATWTQVPGVIGALLTNIDDVVLVREALPDAIVMAGSGVTQDTVKETLRYADAVIVGTALKQDGETTAPVDIARVRSFTAAAQ